MQTTNDLKNMALFSDTTEEFVSPAEPKMNDTVTIRFRSAKDAIKCVSLRSKDTRYLMTKEKSVGCFDYYAVQVRLERRSLPIVLKWRQTASADITICGDHCVRSAMCIMNLS